MEKSSPPAALLTTILFIVGLVGAQHLIRKEYTRLSPPRTSTSQANYQNPALDNESIAAWFEFGKNGSLLSFADDQTARSGYALRLQSLYPAPAWSRVVHWSARAQREGRILVSFGEHKPSSIFLYMTDGDSFSRISRISSSGTDIVADKLHNGRWLRLPITPEDRAAHQKEIIFYQLSGNDIAVSALIVTEPLPEAS